MSHPHRFDADDPLLAKLRELCLSFPGADEKVSHGRPAFFTKKIFTMYGAVEKGDHHSGRYDKSMVFLPDPDECVALEQHDRTFVPAYWGPHGWLGYELTSDATDWDEVGELVEESFRNTATKKLISELESNL